MLDGLVNSRLVHFDAFILLHEVVDDGRWVVNLILVVELVVIPLVDVLPLFDG